MGSSQELPFDSLDSWHFIFKQYFYCRFLVSKALKNSYKDCQLTKGFVLFFHPKRVFTISKQKDFHERSFFGS